MSHPDEDALAARALGAPDAAVDEHAATCVVCASTLDGLRRTTTALRGAADVEQVAPPASVWAAIRAEVAPVTTPVTPVATLAPLSAPQGGRRGRRRWLPAAAGFLVGAAAATVVVVAVTHDADDAPSTTVVARGTLDPIDGSDVSGTIEMTDTDDVRHVTVVLDGPHEPGDHFVQAWLLDPATNGMVALGVVDGTTQTFAVPAGLDLDAYDSVDVSLEPFDGDPAHSATSLARGVLAPS
ncbi:anti-sigma factor [Luteimicrobium subarcticum]|uniref:Anti-sigma-K factor rskA n=1 Tax=Luteimicrobium subarcticum TaxID=620910 RepID=A0A2M8WS12_9MICO|nr:anti-sigma factor [Luteimicrobium subarcticum]PJI93732.1 anti-sigma-K factor rskA [Luteimicrobium subarcticum]